MMTETRIKELESKGFKRWTKGNFDRLYINATALGLKYSCYNTGNISNATFNGEWISNSQARRFLAAKTFVDIKTGEANSTNEDLLNAAKALAGIE